MKTTFNWVGFALIIAATISTTVLICLHSIADAFLYVIAPMLTGVLIFACTKLWITARICARKVDSPDQKRADGTPIHHVWPLWTFLGFFILEVACIVGCWYLAAHIWCPRDLLNFTLFALLSFGVFIKFPRLI